MGTSTTAGAGSVLLPSQWEIHSAPPFPQENSENSQKGN